MIYRVRDLIKELKKLDPNRPIVVKIPNGETHQIQNVSKITNPYRIIL